MEHAYAIMVLEKKLVRLRRKHRKLSTWADMTAAAIQALESDIEGLKRMVPEYPTQETFDFLVNYVLEQVENDDLGYLLNPEDEEVLDVPF